MRCRHNDDTSVGGPARGRGLGLGGRLEEPDGGTGGLGAERKAKHRLDLTRGREILRTLHSPIREPAVEGPLQVPTPRDGLEQHEPTVGPGLVLNETRIDVPSGPADLDEVSLSIPEEVNGHGVLPGCPAAPPRPCSLCTGLGGPESPSRGRDGPRIHLPRRRAGLLEPPGALADGVGRGGKSRARPRSPRPSAGTLLSGAGSPERRHGSGGPRGPRPVRGRRRARDSETPLGGDRAAKALAGPPRGSWAVQGSPWISVAMGSWESLGRPLGILAQSLVVRLLGKNGRRSSSCRGRPHRPRLATRSPASGGSGALARACSRVSPCERALHAAHGRGDREYGRCSCGPTSSSLRRCHSNSS